MRRIASSLMMLVAMSVLASLSDAQPSREKKTVVSLSPSFRAAAEDMVDCIDELSIAASGKDDVYRQQDVKCVAKLNKLHRLATTAGDESEWNALRDYYAHIQTCRLTRQSANRPPDAYSNCLNEQFALRARAIKIGKLRA